MSWIYNVVFVIVIAVWGNKVSGCPDGWVTHQSACYLFSHDTQRWIDALLMCREWEAHLVEIHDTAKHAFLKAQVHLQDKQFWIGLSDVEKENEWIWIDSGRTLNETNFRNWYKGQPDNNLSDENCVAMDYFRHYQWKDYACVSQFHYICELTENSFGQIVGK